MHPQQARYLARWTGFGVIMCCWGWLMFRQPWLALMAICLFTGMCWLVHMIRLLRHAG